MQLLCIPQENHGPMLDFQRRQVDKRLQSYKQTLGREPYSLSDLVLETEYAHSVKSLSAMKGPAADRLKRSKNLLREIAESKVNLQEREAWTWIRMAGAEALCFGILYPGLTWDIMSRMKRPDVADEDWKRFCKENPSGRAEPHAEAPYSLEQQEADALEQLRAYIQEMRPELAGFLERLDKGRAERTAKGMLTITPRAAEELKAIQAANARDASHVLRIDTEGDGFSLWLGPEKAGDFPVGSEETVALRASPESKEILAGTEVVIDCVDGEDGQPRLIVYPKHEPP